MSSRRVVQIALFVLLAAAIGGFFLTRGNGANTALAVVAAALLFAWIASVVNDRGLYERGWPAYALAALFAVFYVTLYYTEVFTDLVHLVWAGGNKWHFYGLLYTIAITAGGLWYLKKNRNSRSRYQVIRTVVIIAVQAAFAFSIPILMGIFLGADYYLSYLWPLKISYFYPDTFDYLGRQMTQTGHPAVPKVLVAYSFLASLVAMPVLAFTLGKRWYCSWVCGCGGLANTFGDPWRHLSSKTRWTWRFEMVAIHAVLLFALVTTAFVLFRPVFDVLMPGLKDFSYQIQKTYGFFVVTLLSGMLGVIVYPVLGTRFWCRFFCPMAALLGVIQKFGRYRITINGELCMACGNCSKYCEMGIDVRAYAMRGEDFRRASCVGCGLCQHVCPRGVLRLENGRKGERIAI